MKYRNLFASVAFLPLALLPMGNGAQALSNQMTLNPVSIWKQDLTNNFSFETDVCSIRKSFDERYTIQLDKNVSANVDVVIGLPKAYYGYVTVSSETGILQQSLAVQGKTVGFTIAPVRSLGQLTLSIEGQNIVFNELAADGAYAVLNDCVARKVDGGVVSQSSGVVAGVSPSSTVSSDSQMQNLVGRLSQPDEVDDVTYTPQSRFLTQGEQAATQAIEAVDGAVNSVVDVPTPVTDTPILAQRENRVVPPVTVDEQGNARELMNAGTANAPTAVMSDAERAMALKNKELEEQNKLLLKKLADKIDSDNIMKNVVARANQSAPMLDGDERELFESMKRKMFLLEREKEAIREKLTASKQQEIHAMKVDLGALQTIEEQEERIKILEDRLRDKSYDNLSDLTQDAVVTELLAADPVEEVQEESLVEDVVNDKVMEDEVKDVDVDGNADTSDVEELTEDEAVDAVEDVLPPVVDNIENESMDVDTVSKDFIDEPVEDMSVEIDVPSEEVSNDVEQPVIQDVFEDVTGDINEVVGDVPTALDGVSGDDIEFIEIGAPSIDEPTSDALVDEVVKGVEASSDSAAQMYEEIEMDQLTPSVED